MVQLVWEFIVREDKIRDFERAYASDGAWAKLFQKASGYQGTRLVRDSAQPNRYLTVDTWDALESHQQMRIRFAHEYESIERACEDFSKSERNWDVFEVL